jgi:hypothetical protein
MTPDLASAKPSESFWATSWMILRYGSPPTFGRAVRGESGHGWADALAMATRARVMLLSVSALM